MCAMRGLPRWRVDICKKWGCNILWCSRRLLSFVDSLADSSILFAVSVLDSNSCSNWLGLCCLFPLKQALEESVVSPNAWLKVVYSLTGGGCKCLSVLFRLVQVVFLTSGGADEDSNDAALF